jgi:Lipase (class 3)
MAAIDLSVDPDIEILGVMTFGQPLAFDDTGARDVSRMFEKRFVRFVHEDDIVPRLVPGYHPHGDYFWIHKGKPFRGPERSLTVAAPNGEGGRAGADPVEIVAPELQPLSEAEFKAFEQEWREENRARSTDGEAFQTAFPNVTDHAIERYVKAIETHVAKPLERHP